MTVGELIEALKQEDQGRIIVMSCDAEGNGHSPLSSFWVGAYRPETTWCGDVGFEKLAPGYTEKDVIRDGMPAIILSPIN